MRNQLEERGEALENVILDLIDTVTKSILPTISVPNIDSLLYALREVGQRLTNLYPVSNTQIVGSSIPEVAEAMKRLKVASENMLDRRSGIT